MAIGTRSGEEGFTLIELLVTSAVMMIVLGITSGILARSSTMFTQQRIVTDGRNGSAAATDMIARMLRQSSCTTASVYCQAILPDEDNNGVFDSVRVRADWNPHDGVLDDPYEDVLFVVDDGVLFKREPSDSALVPFADGITSIRFAYTSQNGAPLTNVVARPDLIGGVTMTVISVAPDGLPPITTTTAVSVRRIK